MVSHEGNDFTCFTKYLMKNPSIYHCKSIRIPLQFAEDRDTVYITPSDVPYQECHTIMSYTRKQSVSIIGYRGIVKVGCNSTAKNFAIFSGISGSATSIFITNITFYNSIITAVNVELLFQHVALLNESRIYTNATSYSAGFNLNCSRVSIHLVDTRISGSKECNQHVCYGLAGIFIRNCSLQEFYMTRGEFINARFVSYGMTSSLISILHSRFDALNNNLELHHGIDVAVAMYTNIFIHNTQFSHAGDKNSVAAEMMAALVLREYEHNVLTASDLQRVQAKITISSCTFSHNLRGVMSYGTIGKVMFTNCEFSNNAALGYGAAATIETNKRSLELLGDEAHSNKRNFWGFTNCTFYGNEAKSLETTLNNVTMQIPGNGGAVYAVTGEVGYLNCTFTENKATQFGGALFIGEKSSAYFDRRCTITNSMSAVTSVQGELIFSRGRVTGSDLILKANKAKNDLSLLSHERVLSFWTLNLQVMCPVGAIIRAVHGRTGRNLKQTSKVVHDLIYHYCFQCEQGFYSLYGGKMNYTGSVAVGNGGKQIQAHGSVVSEAIKCLACNYGGRCYGGTVQAKPNFWGYRVGDEIKFISCPTGYCCLKTSECVTYNTCNSGRTGILCGQCLKGYSETLLSMNCLKNSNCKANVFFWPAVAVSGFVYMFVFFLYKDKIQICTDFILKKLTEELKWLWNKVISSMKKKRAKPLNSIQRNRKTTVDLPKPPFASPATVISSKPKQVYGSGNGYSNDLKQSGKYEASHHWRQDTEDSTAAAGHGYNNPTYSSCSTGIVGIEFEQQGNRYNDHLHDQHEGNVENSKCAESKESLIEDKDDLERGLMKIIFYFFQVASLLKITVDQDDENPGFFKNPLKSIEIIAIGIFNFNFGFVDSVQGYCPFTGLNSIRKILLKCGFVMYLYFIFVVLYGIYFVIMKACCSNKNTEPTNRNSNKKSTMTFKIRLLIALLDIMTYSYQTMADSTLKLLHCVSVGDKRVLFIDGSVTCFVFYQYFAMIYNTVCIFPFFLIFIFGPKLLRKKRITKSHFLLSCIFPLPYLSLWFIKFSAFKSKYNNESVADSLKKDETEELLKDLESPFRNDNSGPIHWEGVLIARRLILLVIITFMNDPIPRLFSLFTACTIFLAHHIHVKPFKVASSNNLETISLTVLVLLSGMNLVHATFVAAEIDEFGSNSTIVNAFHIAEILLHIWLVILLVIGLAAGVSVALVTKCFRTCTGQSINSCEQTNSAVQATPHSNMTTVSDRFC